MATPAILYIRIVINRLDVFYSDVQRQKKQLWKYYQFIVSILERNRKFCKIVSLCQVFEPLTLRNFLPLIYRALMLIPLKIQTRFFYSFPSPFQPLLLFSLPQFPRRKCGHRFYSVSSYPPFPPIHICIETLHRKGRRGEREEKRQIWAKLTVSKGGGGGQEISIGRD